MSLEFIARNGLISLGNIVVSGSITSTGTVTISGSIASASFASTASSADNFLARGTITAQTLVVQTITSSVDFVTGSTRFGSLSSNTHQFTGSVSITGSLTTSIAALGSAASLFLVSDGGIIKSRTAAQTLSDIAALPLAGGTLTGALSGTSATFSSSVTAGGQITMQYGGNPRLLLRDTDAGAGNVGILFREDTNDKWTLASVGGAFQFFNEANASNALYITSGNNVGIGTTSPDVTGFGYTTLTIKGGTTAGYAGVLELQTTQTTTNGQNVGIIAFLDGTSRNAQIGVQRDTSTSTSNMMFYTNAGSGIVERMKITSDGYLRLATKGIQFNGDTADANSLDDYEEGTFTPNIFYSGTNTPFYYAGGRLGRYTKVGRLVQIQIYLNWDESGSTGNVTVTGLPFTTVTATNRSIPCILTFGLTGLPVAMSITGYIQSNATSIVLVLNDNAGTALSATYTDADQDLYVTAVYESV